MATAYQVSTEYMSYTHGEIIAQCATLEEATKWYLETIEACISDGESNFTDYVCIEEIDGVFAEDGEIEVGNYYDVIKEHVFNECTE